VFCTFVGSKGFQNSSTEPFALRSIFHYSKQPPVMLAAARDKASNVVLSRTQKFMNFVGSFQQVAETQLLGLIALKTVHGILSGNMSLLNSSTSRASNYGRKRAMFALLVVLCRQRLRAIAGFAGQSLQELLNPNSTVETQVRRCGSSNRGLRSERFFPSLHRVHAASDLIPLKTITAEIASMNEKETPELEDKEKYSPRGSLPCGWSDDIMEEADRRDRLCAIPENRVVAWRSRNHGARVERTGRLRYNVVSRHSL
jgi:hypothetical protein